MVIDTSQNLVYFQNKVYERVPTLAGEDDCISCDIGLSCTEAPCCPNIWFDEVDRFTFKLCKEDSRTTCFKEIADEEWTEFHCSNPKKELNLTKLFSSCTKTNTITPKAKNFQRNIELL